MSSSPGSEICLTTENPRTAPMTSLEEIFRCWHLDAALRRHYDRGLGIEHLYPWQSRCLAEHGVAEGTRNLLYFAPTSGGKTMVAELLLLLRAMGLPSRDHPQGRLEVERQKGAAMEQVARRAVFVLPFISMVTEKVKHLQKVVAPYNRGKPKRKRIKVKALYGSKGGGWDSSTQVAVCTIEKANALINRMAAANELHELCCLVVDELHMIGEDGRGQTLELLLSKVVRANRIAHHHKDNSEDLEGVARDSARSTAGAFTVSRDGRPESSQSMPSRQEEEVGQCGDGPGARRIQTQIIGMSATLSNGAELAAWLGAILHVSDYRPVPLDERVLLGMHVYDKSGNAIRSFSEPAHLETDPDHVVTLCRESCLARDQVIIFCSTKQFCHNCAIKVAKNLMVPASRAVAAQRSALMTQLAKEMSMGVDPILQETIPHGVAFHHAGLADTERSAIEAAFRAGTLRVLAATSTLGAGVNLPAGRVILRNLNAPGGGLSATSYRQMAGRAGRKGSGKTRGEAIIVASNKGQATRATALMNAGLAAVKSTMAPSSDGGAGLTKMILEGVCCGLVKKKKELSDYLGCSLLFHQHQQQQYDGGNADDGCQNLLDHAFAALQLLVDEVCIELVPQKRSFPAVTSAVVRPVIAARKMQLGAKPPLISPYSNFPSGLRRGQPSEGVTTVSAAQVSTIHPVGCAEGVVVDINGRLVPTKLGMAIFRSSLGPAEGLLVYRDLSEAKHGINLRNTLRLAYLLTPMCPPSGLKPNWERLHAMYSRAKNAIVRETLPPGGRSAALSLVDDFHKIGINEGHLHLWASRGPRGCIKQGPLLSPDYVKGVASARSGVIVEGMSRGVSRGGGNRAGMSAAQKAVRLVAAMALKDVSDGYNLGQVAKSYGMNKGDLQSLRQATATFSAMVASFLKELGWTMFLMIVKGYIPRLSLGVSNDLLPLMQVPGISRKEASALYQGGILNAKSLLAASQDRIATALRMNVPFRTRRGGGEGGKGPGVGESVHFERRAQMLKNAAKDMDVKREKGNKAQAMKLLRAVQGRLGGSLGDPGGANDLVGFAAAPKGCKRKISTNGSGSCSLGSTTGLSDGDSGDDSSSSSESDASEDLEGDDMDRAVEAMLAGERVAQEEEDSDSEEDDLVSVDVDTAGEAEAETEREVVLGVIGSEMLRRETAGDGAVTEENDFSSFAVEKIKRSLGNEVSSAEDAREFHGGSNKRRKTSGVDEKPSGGTRDFPVPDPRLKYFSGGVRGCEASKAPAVVDAIGAGEGEGFMSSVGGVTGAGWRKRQGCESAPTTPTLKIVPVSSYRGCGGGGGERQQGIRNDARTSRVELRSSPSFLYEGDTSTIGLVPSPSPKAMVLSPQGEPPSPASSAAAVVVRNGARVRNVFSDSGGAATMAEFSSTWRRSRCFSFTLGGRSVDWVVDTRRKGSGMTLGCSYKRAWEALSSRMPLVPYTVPSAGESFVPMNRHESENAMWVLSGIAVSFDGVSSHYLPLPPHLPGRPAEWRRPRHRHKETADNNIKSPGFGNSWETLPGKAMESVTHFVGFPWFCPDCSGRDRRHGCVIHSARKHGESGKRCKPWNQTLLVSRRWNAIGVDVINRLATEEPSGRWKLVRDVLEGAISTKICLDMKGALVCLRSLGIDLRGPLEDPEVAKWLLEPAVEEVTPPQPQDASKKKRKTPLPPPPRAPRESLSLDKQPKGFVELWGMQAAATLTLMGRRERDLKNLGLTLAFHLIEMPAVRAAAMMEYCGIALKSVVVSDIRRDLELKLRDLESVADQLAGDRETAGDKTALASPKRIHDILYAAMGIQPPPSWRSSGVGEGNLAAPPPRVGGASKRVSLGPTDTASLQALLEGSGKEELGEDARGFIQAVIQYRALSPASRSLSGLLLARRWHPHLGGVRVNPKVELFTTTGRMIVSEPPLQNLEHKIRLKRSWRLSLAEEVEADLPHVEGLPRVWAGDGGNGVRRESEVEGAVPGSTQCSSSRESRRVIVVNTGESVGISFGDIVGIVADRFVNDPIHHFPSVSGMGDVVDTESMALFWEKRGHPYTPCEASKTRQVLVRLSGGNAKVYSYPADKVFRLCASFLRDSKAESLVAASRLGAESCPEAVPRNHWFGEEALLRPRAGLVPSAGYVFVSADYSQIEMRLMAHLSGDPYLLGVFLEGGDVFRGIAAALEGRNKQASHVTDDERRQTKVVVYGVLYGQSAEALAPQLGVSRPKAWKIRQTVLKTYPKLKDYLQKVKDDCKKSGFVETLLGRRRYLPHINSSDIKERARAERQAANTVCQGSAADLLKLAVTNVAARLEKCEWMSRSVNSPCNASEWQYETPCRFPEASQRSRAEMVKNPPCRLVLSIHDELLYEVLEPHAKEVAKVVKACMEGACSLLVPLVAHPKIGKTWASMADVEEDG